MQKGAKRCPCCGGEAYSVEVDDLIMGHYVVIRCTQCGLQTSHVKVAKDYSAEGLAWKMWNARYDNLH